MSLTQVPSGVMLPTGVSAGTYGTANTIPQMTIDAAGRVTSVANVVVSIPSTSYLDANNVILVMNNVISSNATMNTGQNGVTVGPVYINPSKQVTLSANTRWVVL